MTETTDATGQHRAPDQGWLAAINMSEPVRLRLYAITVALVALLVGYGLLDNVTGALWLGAAAAVLGITGTELTRAAVVSPATARQVALDAAGSSATTDLQAATVALHINSVPGAP